MYDCVDVLVGVCVRPRHENRPDCLFTVSVSFAHQHTWHGQNFSVGAIIDFGLFERVEAC